MVNFLFFFSLFFSSLSLFFFHSEPLLSAEIRFLLLFLQYLKS